MKTHQESSKSAEKTQASAPFFSPVIQRKLTVNQPGDHFEQQADAVADQVMRMKTGDAPIVQRTALTAISGGLQRKCAGCENEEKLHRKETSSSDASGKAAPASVQNVLSSGGGNAMNGGTRQFMESRFGQDFSGVRIHTDSKAAQSAEAIQARAYTSGNQIVFGNWEYQPESESGKRLLAHELVHVGQQGGDLVSRRRRRPQIPTPSYDFEGETVTIDTLNLPSGTSGNDAIRLQMEDFRQNILTYFRNFDRGLNNFETSMSFSTNDETEAHLMDAATSSILKFFFEHELSKAITLLSEAFPVAGTVIGGLKAVVGSQIEEFQRANTARGEARISSFIRSLRETISSLESGALADFRNLRTEMTTTYDGLSGSESSSDSRLVGEKARFVQALQNMVSELQSSMSSVYDPAFFQEMIATKFSGTGQYSGPLTQGGQRSGQLYIKMKIYMDEDGSFTFSESDSQWSLMTNAPQNERLGDSLEESMRSQGRKPYQSPMNKTVLVRIEKEISGLNRIIDGQLSFSRNPNDITVSGAYHVGVDYSDYFRSLWGIRAIRQRILGIDQIQGANTIEFSVFD